MTDLHAATRDLHHGAEAHPFMQRMAAGEITRQEWTDWIGALRVIHEVLDPHLHYALQRSGHLLIDQCAMLPLVPREVRAATKFARSLASASDILGAAYIFSGAHLRGGAVLRRRLEAAELPCLHLRVVPEGAEGVEKQIARLGEDALRAMRACTGAASGAEKAFKAVIAIATEIEVHNALVRKAAE
jgi:heme oxygenase